MVIKMIDNMQTLAIMSVGMKILRENLWEDITTKELFAKDAEFEKQHPEFIPKTQRLLDL